MPGEHRLEHARARSPPSAPGGRAASARRYQAATSPTRPGRKTPLAARARGALVGPSPRTTSTASGSTSRHATRARASRRRCPSARVEPRDARAGRARRPGAAAPAHRRPTAPAARPARSGSSSTFAAGRPTSLDAEAPQRLGDRDHPRRRAGRRPRSTNRNGPAPEAVVVVLRRDERAPRPAPSAP